MNKKEIEKEIENLLLENGYELVELNIKTGSNPILELYIYHEDGVSLDDCSYVTELIDKNLDLDSYFPDSYNLEVASPGLDRNLKTDGDFRRNLNNKVEVKLYQKINDKKELVGELVGYDENNVKIESEGEVIEIEREKIATMKQYIDFGRF